MPHYHYAFTNDLSSIFVETERGFDNLPNKDPYNQIQMPFFTLDTFHDDQRRVHFTR